MSLKKIFSECGFVTVSLSFFALLFSGGVFAAGDTTMYGQSIYGQPVSGQPVYGGGVMTPRFGQVLVDKFVQNPASGIFVDHLGPTDPKYRPQQVIVFRLRVSNPGTEPIDEIVVDDIFPSASGVPVVDFMSGPGSYDADRHTLRFSVSNLEPDDSREFEVKGRIVHPAVLGSEKRVLCVSPGNVVEAHSGDLSDRDESTFCIEKEIVVPPSVPAAGPALWIISLVGFTTSLFSGLFLLKNTPSIS